VYSLSLSLFSKALIALTHELNRADSGYQVHKTERKISHLYKNDLKLPVRDEDELENEIKTVSATAKEVNMNPVLKNFEICDNNVAFSTIVYQLLISCSSEITLDIFRQ
jgi:hypothetical protein